jgi:integrase
MVMVNKCPTCGTNILFNIHIHSDYNIKTLLQKYIESLELKGKAYSYVRHLKSHTRLHILPFFAGIDVREIRSFHIEEFNISLFKKRLSNKTVKHILDAMKGFMNYQYRLERIEKMPLFPRIEHKPVRPKNWLDNDSQARVLSFIPPEHRLFFEVLIETGIRPGEGRALKKKDIEEEGLYISSALDERGVLKTTKTGKEYFRSLSGDVLLRLQSHTRLNFPDSYIFTHRGQPYNKHVDRIWKAACTQAGISIPLYQGTRHSKASQRRAELEQGMREELKKVLGHTSATTTLKHYALPTERKVSL